MGSLDKRIEALEKLYQADSHPDPQREAILAELRQLEERHRPLRERAEREAEEGKPQRLRALQELEEFVRRRYGA